jgi:hypothetical protein
MTRRETGVRLLSFISVLGLALVLEWSAPDLAWGIWASSLSYGLVYGLLIIFCNPEEADAEGSFGRKVGISTFLVFVFSLFHLYQGMVLEMIFPLTNEGGQREPLALFPLRAFGAYWPVVAGAFLSRTFELQAATQPSDDPHRLLAPFRQIAVMQVLVFVFLFLAAAGVIRFAVYAILVFFYLPDDLLRAAVRRTFHKIKERMNDPSG